MSSHLESVTLNNVGVSIVRSESEPINHGVIWIDSTDRENEIPKVFFQGLWREVLINAPTQLDATTPTSSLSPTSNSTSPSADLLRGLIADFITVNVAFSGKTDYNGRLDKLITKVLSGQVLQSDNVTSNTILFTAANAANIATGTLGWTHFEEIPLSKISPSALWVDSDDTTKFDDRLDKIVISQDGANALVDAIIRDVFNIITPTSLGTTPRIERAIPTRDPDTNEITGDVYNAIRNGIKQHLSTHQLIPRNFSNSSFVESNRLLWEPSFLGTLGYEHLREGSIEQRHLSHVITAYGNVAPALGTWHAIVIRTFYDGISRWYRGIPLSGGTAGVSSARQEIGQVLIRPEQLSDDVFSIDARSVFSNGAFTGIHIKDDTYDDKIFDNTINNKNIGIIERGSTFTTDVVPTSIHGYESDGSIFNVNILSHRVPAFSLEFGLLLLVRVEIDLIHNSPFSAVNYSFQFAVTKDLGLIRYTILSRGRVTEFRSTEDDTISGDTISLSLANVIGRDAKSLIKWTATILKSTSPLYDPLDVFSIIRRA